jgi:hypothetical protein
MPRKSTISHQGDIFDSQTKTHRRRNLNAFYGHPLVTFWWEIVYLIPQIVEGRLWPSSAERGWILRDICGKKRSRIAFAELNVIPFFDFEYNGNNHKKNLYDRYGKKTI